MKFNVLYLLGVFVGSLLLTLTEASRNVEKLKFPLNGDEEYKLTLLPNLFAFSKGLDYSTGERKGQLFRFTFENAKRGYQAFKHVDFESGYTFDLPDELSFTGWGESCISEYSTQSHGFGSVKEYLAQSSSESNIGFETTTDVVVTVPVQGVMVTADAQVRAALGFGRSNKAREYYYHMLRGETNVMYTAYRAAVWTVAWRQYKSDSSTKMPGPAQLSYEFSQALSILKEVCEKNAPDEEGRLANPKHPLAKTACDHEARKMVEHFGTHYTRIGTYGGEMHSNFYYNEASTSAKDRQYIQSYSREEFRSLFYGSSEISASSSESQSHNQMSSTISHGQVESIGGNPNAESREEWCETVQLKPAIIKNKDVEPISELIFDDPRGKFAVFMAIMDKWFCDDGTAKDLNSTNGSIKCDCHKELLKHFELDDQCIPKAPKCYDDNGVLTECHFGKLVVGLDHAANLELQTESPNKLLVYVQIPRLSYAIMGSLGIKDYDYRSGYTASISPLTSSSIATEATGFTKVWQDDISTESHGQVTLSVWRPQCKAGYNSVSDFFQRGTVAPPNGIYKGYQVKPCIVMKCLMICDVGWMWADQQISSSPRIAFMAMIAGDAKYGSGLGQGGTFFRAVPDTYHPSYGIPRNLRLCLDPACVVEE